MATNVIMPALGLAQESGVIVRWLKSEGDTVSKGEPLVEIETDKARVEIEARASGILAHVVAAAGDEIPVGQVIASILSANEALPGTALPNGAASAIAVPAAQPTKPSQQPVNNRSAVNAASSPEVVASPLASRIAAEHKLDLHLIKPAGKRVQKADVLTYLQQQGVDNAALTHTRLAPASPKARRLLAELGIDAASLVGTGPDGAVVTADVMRASRQRENSVALKAIDAISSEAHELTTSTIWRIMAERTTQSWTSIPHFYLVREANASRLLAWREQLRKRSSVNVTYTDLLVKLVATTLRGHLRLNAAWSKGKIILNNEIHVGLAVAVEEGLVVPVIHRADQLSLSEIAERRSDLVARAQASKLRPEDLQGGTFTISNLGMYGIDAFTAIINPPQVAILAVGRIAQRVVPVDGRASVQPMMALNLSCDHRVVDGARGAQFLSALADLIEEPLGLLS
jgi:pyruvate dehydrogenase E2 component (dihydrolipoamide acetyltransferase)